MEEERIYSVRVDGNEITQVTLQRSEYATQQSRDVVRAKIAHTYKIPRHYLRLVQIKPLVRLKTNMQTGKTERIQ